jgi:hypothetical protein
VSRGLGRHIWVTPPDSVRAWALSLFIAELGYFFTIVFVKWSILAFYWRSFHVRRSIRIPIWTLATVVGLWGTAVVRCPHGDEQARPHQPTDMIHPDPRNHIPVPTDTGVLDAI